jgi:hypothetical protein
MLDGLSVSVAPDVVARTTRTLYPETPTLLEQTGSGNAERVGKITDKLKIPR